jgi:16S rRNA processing protein RimM
MGRRDPKHLVVGHLNKPHGTRGEFYVWPLTDHPERVFAPGVVLLLGEEKDDEPNPDLPPLRVVAARPFQRGVLVQFGGVEDRNDAELFRGRYLYQSIDDVAPLEEGEVFYHQLLDMEVVTVDGEQVGSIVEVFEAGPADLLEVRGPRGLVMLPYRPEIVVSVDVEDGVMVIDPPDGLLDLHGPADADTRHGGPAPDAVDDEASA